MMHIAVLLPAMRMGGAEKICLNFLDYLTSEYKVTMILSKKEGDLLPLVPKCVEIIEDPLLSFKDILFDDLKHFRLAYLCKDLCYYFRVKTGRNTEKNYCYLVSRTPAMKEEYDCAIGYVANVSTQIFCLADRISAKTKIAWIHGETTELKDTALFAEYYHRFDKIYAVSKTTREHFVNRFPNCENRTDVYYNPIRSDEILKNAESENQYVFEKDVINIVTVGRISPEKGMDMIPEIVNILIKDNLDVHWYIVGDGSEYQRIKDSVVFKGLTEHITLTGNQINPYPFIKNCDIYVQPSYEEGYSTTVCEAGILGKVIVGTTTSGGIREQIDDGVDGILADPNPEDLARKISMLIANPDLRHRMEQKIRQKDFSNTKEFIKFKIFMGGHGNDC